MFGFLQIFLSESQANPQSSDTQKIKLFSLLCTNVANIFSWIFREVSRVIKRSYLIMIWNVKVAVAAGVSVVLVAIALEVLWFIIVVRLLVVWLVLMNLSVVRLLVVNLWVVSVADVLDNCVETVVVISGVRNNSGCAVSFLQRIFSLNNVSVASFPL